MTKKNTTPDECPLCETRNIETDTYGFKGICTDCGFVLDNHGTIDPPEWAVSSSEEALTGPEVWLDYCRVTNKTEQRLAQACAIIEEVATILPLPIDIRKQTANVYATAFEHKLTDGRDIKTMITACLRVGSQHVGQPIPRKRLVEIEDVTNSGYQKSLRAINEAIDSPPEPVDSTDYLWFFEDILDLQQAQIAAAEELLQVVDSGQHMVGKDPAGIAAAGVYEAVDEVTQRDAAETVGITTETIRQRSIDIEEIEP